MTFDASQVLEALLGLVPLDSLPRTGWTLRGVSEPESIAGHILGVAHVALALAPRESERGLELDLGRVLAMALVHDAPEALSGDLPQPAAKYLPSGAKREMERAIARELVDPLSSAAAGAWAEFEAQATPEARFVKACDRLQMGIRWHAYNRSAGVGPDGQAATIGALAEFGDALERADFAEFECLAAVRAAILLGR